MFLKYHSSFNLHPQWHTHSSLKKQTTIQKHNLILFFLKKIFKSCKNTPDLRPFRCFFDEIMQVVSLLINCFSLKGFWNVSPHLTHTLTISIPSLNIILLLTHHVIHTEITDHRFNFKTALEFTNVTTKKNRFYKLH